MSCNVCLATNQLRAAMPRICTYSLKFVSCRAVSSGASTPELSLVGAVTVCSPTPLSVSLSLSVMLGRLPILEACSGMRLVMSGKAPLAGVLSSHVHAGFGASQKTEP